MKKDKNREKYLQKKIKRLETLGYQMIYKIELQKINENYLVMKDF
jgi:hypothetical protein